MGNHLSTPTSIDSYVSELVEVEYEKSLTGTRLFKTIKCKHKQGYIVVKIYIKPSPTSLHHHLDTLKAQRASLRLGHVLHHQRLLETDRAVYAIRQYLYSNLYDRISTRPFLSLEEKRWIAWQLLQTVSEIHALQVCHGDIKMENVMVTTWNWVYLVDFSPFKPTLLPVDNPADFTFFFDNKRSSTLAPERLVSHDGQAPLNSSMDVFSCACVIAELFLERPLFTFPQLLRYKQGDYDPLETIKHLDKNLVEMLTPMLTLDPTKRPTAKTSLASKFFPKYYPELHEFVTQVSTPMRPTMVSSDARPILAEADQRLQLLSESLPSLLNLFQVYKPESEHPAVILASIVTSNIRSTIYPLSRITAIQMLSTLSEFMNDQEKTERILPSLIHLLSDTQAHVRTMSLIAITQLMSNCQEVEEGLFPEYILPSLRGLASDNDTQVRCQYAKSIAPLAEAALKFSQDPKDVQDMIQEEVVSLLIDPSPLVKRALLTDVVRLCIFLGRQRANDVLLSHMITYLNDRDWRLRAAFCESIVGVSTFVGGPTLEEYILPLLIQALTDGEEWVVVKVLNALETLAELGLLSKPRVKELVQNVAPLLLHPNIWIRFAAIGFLSSLGKHLSIVDQKYLVHPGLENVVRETPWDLSPQALLHCIKSPVERSVYDQALETGNIPPSLNVLAKYLQKCTQVRKRQQVGEEVSTSFSARILGITPQTVFLSPVPEVNEVKPPSPVDIPRTVPQASQGKKSLPASSISLEQGIAKMTLTTDHSRWTDGLFLAKAREMHPPPLHLGPVVDYDLLATVFSQKQGRPKTDLDMRKWRPEGTLVSTFYEHSASVNLVKTSPDCAFFATASDDGTVKIWDTQRLERNVTNRARLTHEQGGKVRAMCFVQNSHGLVSASEGSVQVSRIEYMYTGTTPKYSGYHVVGEQQMGEDVVQVEEFSNIVCCATTKNKLAGWDMRRRGMAWEIKLPPSLGGISCFVTDKMENWILVGTTLGVFSLVDLRFGIPVKSWQHPSNRRINHLSLSPRIRRVVASIDNKTSEVSVWDVESGEAKEIYCVIGKEKLDDEINRLYGKGLKPIEPSITTLPPLSSERQSSIQKFLYPSPNSLVTVGADRRIRFWDRSNVEDSFVVSPEESDLKPRYSTQTHEDQSFYMEYVTPHLSQGEGKRPPLSSIARQLSGPLTGISDVGKTLVNHLDCITDVGLTLLPYPMLVTTGRDGLVKVWK